MAGMLRFGILRAAGLNTKAILNVENNLPCLVQSCNISGKSLRGTNKISKPKPYPYETKDYGFFHALLDKTTHRFDENSKLIVVDGSLASGKTEFAKKLAEELEMKFVPEATMDMIYINSYGYDMRQLDSKLPESCRSFDIKNFHKDPTNRLAGNYQIQMYMLRYSQYVDALAHILSTGQGVVMERSCYSDFVFLEAMYRQNYISKGVRSVYYDLKQTTIPEILKPHLVIYLDVPPKVIMDRIKKRNIDYEVNSKVLTEQYLTDVENIYKQQYLKEISTHAELLVYDWSNGGETEVIVEDIERIDFDRFEEDRHNPKMKDWRFPKEWDWCEIRMRFTNEKPDLMNAFNIPRYDVPELLRGAEDMKAYHDIWFNAPGQKYRLGYNEDMGDTGILTKNKLELRNTL